MFSKLAVTALLFIGLTYAAPAVVEARANECPPGAPYQISYKPENPWFGMCTSYDSTYPFACNRGIGPDPAIGIVYRPCTDPYFQTV
ncbi:hypothetical protein HYFRA_00004789 [Hymenoscyphus fraxineus]|uniref:Uncharacterized protein n=1 Tax=Hymenoscyphus fraxineus TaxID=746836 RepID=A0A9N9KPC6_9HELO|nr:hypothetical protein HYFRA_00004789 [Hymenoscyphus fraxineus]